MDPNQNPPSERDWTEQEKEEFFASTDAITGLPNGSLAGAWASNGAANWTNASKPTGIHVTAITPPEQGWPVAFYCPICKETTFLLSPWAIKPKEADYWYMMEICGNEVDDIEHREMKLEMKGYSSPFELKLGGILL